MAKADLRPSAVMAEVAALIHSWEMGGHVDETWIQRAESNLGRAATRAVSHPPDIAMLLGRARRVLNARRLATAANFLEAAEVLQRLDEWHGPIGLPSCVATNLTDLQEQALRHLMVESNGFNEPDGHGVIIPAAARADPERLPPRSVVAKLLHSTTYLPHFIGAGDLDNSRVASNRVVELRYARRPSRPNDPRGEIDGEIQVAISPVLQDKADARIIHDAASGSYGVQIAYDPARLEPIVAAAIAGEAHLLFMPEMAVDGQHIKDLASAIRRAAAAHLAARGIIPQLRFVVSGVSRRSAGVANNSVVVLDVTGKRVLEQDKLSRWNLKWYHQRNYGIVPTCCAGADDLTEDIPGGRRMWIADLEHLGRFLTLICADMDHDKPGDWLVRNLAVDWLHAPIMDKSIAWHRDGLGALQPWIVQRAERAAENGVPRVIVTNSVFLTLLLNDHNAANPTPEFPVVDRCAVAFLLDTSGGLRTFRQIEASLPCANPMIEIVQWREGFAAFPP